MKKLAYAKYIISIIVLFSDFSHYLFIVCVHVCGACMSHCTSVGVKRQLAVVTSPSTM